MKKLWHVFREDIEADSHSFSSFEDAMREAESAIADGCDWSYVVEMVLCYSRGKPVVSKPEEPKKKGKVKR